jgi:hypothetical protein
LGVVFQSSRFKAHGVWLPRYAALKHLIAPQPRRFFKISTTGLLKTGITPYEQILGEQREARE